MDVKYIVFLIFLFSTDLFLCHHEGDEESTTEEVEYHEPGQELEDCVCVSLSQCEDGDIITDGSNGIDPRKGSNEIPLEETSIARSCGPFDVCCRNPDGSTVKPYEHHCGTRHSAGVSGRIVSKGAGDAQFGEWPWQAAIVRKEGDNYAMKCGGTLIDNQHIVTVAHCAKQFEDNPENMIIRLGEYDTTNEEEFLPHEDYEVTVVKIHPEYNPKNFRNDIAIVTLSTPVEFKLHIDSVCLPRKDDDFTGQNCTTTGFGVDAYEKGEYSTVLKEVSLPMLANPNCQKMLRKTRLGNYFKLHDSFVCAGGSEGVDACEGDGGGPLVCFNRDGTYTLAGLVAWGVECGQEGIPGVYVDVRKFVDWISEETSTPVEEYFSSPEE